jgi:hypothetical protein
LISAAAPDGKGSSIDKMGLFFIFGLTPKPKIITLGALGALARKIKLFPRRSRFPLDPGKPLEEGGQIYAEI